MTTGSALARFERVVMENGLRLLVAPDRSSSVVAVAVVYDVGFRSEPEGRTGFAHLFEHLMFQGSKNVGKAEHPQLIEAAGGVMNGHTMADITAYYEALPSGGLELALWLEADRMGALALNEENLANQVSVVEEEIKVNVLNRPYGGFPWIPLPGVAFDTYANAHNGYGDFVHLEQAKVADAADFYRRYYAPSNAVLVVAGDCDPVEVVMLVERHFGWIRKSRPPARRSFSEPALARERHKTVQDPLAPQPAFAAGYRLPDPVASPGRFIAYSMLARVLSEGDASRLRARLVHRDRTVTDIGCRLGIFGGDGIVMRDPVLFQVVVFHPGVASTKALLRAVDEELERMAAEGPSPDELARARIAASADHWRGLDQMLNRALSLAGTEVIHGRAELLEQLPELMSAVDTTSVAAAAADLLDQRRAVYELQPKGRR